MHAREDDPKAPMKSPVASTSPPAGPGAPPGGTLKRLGPARDGAADWTPSGAAGVLLTAEEVASVLRLPVKSVYKEAGPGGLLDGACVHLGRRVRFRREEIERLTGRKEAST